MELGLVVLDGWGLNPDPERDAVAAAATPTVDRLIERGAAAQLQTHGRAVGLAAGQMGNSEVGHLTIGAGRVVRQESTRITDAIASWRGESQGVDPPLDENPALGRAFAAARRTNGRVHLLGLVSDGGVHASQAHLHALIDLAAERGVTAVTHAFTDGRDTPPTSAADYLRTLAKHAAAAGTGRVATVTGRYYAMDRDENWDRTQQAYDAVVHRDAAAAAPDPVAAVEAAYDRGTTDEFIEPTLIEGRPALADGDGVVVVNFRADRARQLTRLLAGGRAGVEPPSTTLVAMTEYDETLDVPVAFPPQQPAATLGAVLAERGYTQVRAAESEKYAHVTYFFNGGREQAFPGEQRVIVPSPDVPTYDHQPAMSAPAVTDRAIDTIRGEDPDVLILNYANADMVGHTGDYDAAVAACEAVDRVLDRLVAAIRAADGDLIVTADHGNADELGSPSEPHTAHTTNPTPFVYRSAAGDEPQASDGGLADLAPTVLAVLGEQPPEAMTGTSLLSGTPTRE